MSAQNLIQNGGFEDFKHKNKYHLLVNRAKYWSIPNKSSPDLICKYDTETDVFTDKKDFSKDVRTGNGAMQFSVFELFDYGDYKELATNTLKSPLQKDSLYCFKAYVKLCYRAPLAIDKFQVLVSENKISCPKKTSVNPLGEKYIIDVGNLNFLTNKEKWVIVSGIYKANGNEKFLTIGNFMSFNETNSIVLIKSNMIDRSKFGPYDVAFYIDDISLIPIHDTAECDCNIKRISLETMQNDSLTKDEKNKIIAKEGTIISLKNLYFDNDSYIIKAESNEELDRLYNLLLSNPEIKIKINGYTDNVGNEKHNQWLSEQRTKSVVDYLIQKGISKERLTFTGYGSDNPIATNETEEGRAANRRVEVEFEK